MFNKLVSAALLVFVLAQGAMATPQGGPIQLLCGAGLTACPSGDLCCGTSTPGVNVLPQESIVRDSSPRPVPARDAHSNLASRYETKVSPHTACPFAPARPLPLNAALTHTLHVTPPSTHTHLPGWKPGSDKCLPSPLLSSPLVPHAQPSIFQADLGHPLYRKHATRVSVLLHASRIFYAYSHPDSLPPRASPYAASHTPSRTQLHLPSSSFLLSAALTRVRAAHTHRHSVATGVMRAQFLLPPHSCPPQPRSLLVPHEFSSLLVLPSPLCASSSPLARRFLQLGPYNRPRLIAAPYIGSGRR
ncbi:hypothetical protein K438DRAFT_2030193 [Mycena galopus ATCC 62051]|nr:hypothetical protein K438DRAFT_2030193 [Mycena galopus ATCC 62051]